jgi:hypothetical protein
VIEDEYLAVDGDDVPYYRHKIELGGRRGSGRLRKTGELDCSVE